MSKRTWNSGPPPHVGWWAASIFKDEKAWRWWDGKRWSHCVFDDCDSEQAGFYASLTLLDQRDVYWTDYYPENARVPRVAP